MSFGTVGDTPEYAWLQEVTNNVLVDTGDRVAADMNLLIHMCRAEPKLAQAAMQWLAQDLREMLGDTPAAGAQDPTAKTLVFELGAIASAYAVSRTPAGAEPTLPPELEQLIQWYPIISESMDALAPPASS